MADISRKFGNAHLGITDVVDMNTGQTWKVTGGSRWYWGSTGTIVGSETYNPPDIDFRPLLEF